MKRLSNEAQESRSVEALKDRLSEEAAEVVSLERRLKAVRRRRDELATKLYVAGLSRRSVAKIAGVSDVALIYSERKRAKDGKSARQVIQEQVGEGND